MVKYEQRQWKAGKVIMWRFRALPGVSVLCIISTLSATQSYAAPPRRVVSINLCADQLLLALADSQQIAGLSTGAANPAISYLAGKAKPFPAVRGSAEELLHLQADLVLIGSFDRAYSRAILGRRKIPVLLLQPWQNLEDGREQIQRVASRLGHQARGQRLVSRIDEALNHLRGLASRSGRAGSPGILTLQRRGYVLQGGIISQLARVAGLRDLAAIFQLGPSGTASLEQIVRHQPDFLIVTSLTNRPEDQGEAKLAHSALQRLYPPSRRLVVPDRLSVCAGPSTPALIRHMANEISQKVR